MEPERRIWIARAPAGVWATGPAVITYVAAIQQYKDMGWEVHGPYELVTDEV